MPIVVAGENLFKSIQFRECQRAPSYTRPAYKLDWFSLQ